MIKLDERDIRVVANSRYMRSGGMKKFYVVFFGGAALLIILIALADCFGNVPIYLALVVLLMMVVGVWKLFRAQSRFVRTFVEEWKKDEGS